MECPPRQVVSNKQSQSKTVAMWPLVSKAVGMTKSLGAYNLPSCALGSGQGAIGFNVCPARFQYCFGPIPYHFSSLEVYNYMLEIYNLYLFRWPWGLNSGPHAH
jgi:hypothetical protein